MKTMIVAWREFKSTALTAAFLLAAVVVPAIMIVLAILGPLLFSPKPAPLEGTIAIIDPEDRLRRTAEYEFDAQRIQERYGDAISEAAATVTEGLPVGSIDPAATAAVAAAALPEINLALSFHDAAELETLKDQVLDGEYVAVVEVFVPEDEDENAAGERWRTRLFIPPTINVKHTELIEDTLGRATRRAYIETAGFEVEDVRKLWRVPWPKTVRVSTDGTEKTVGDAAKAFKMFVPMAFMMLLWTGSFVAGQYLLTSTIEEKSNKVMEVLLSAVSPMQLMSGKIIGQGFVGLVMIAMYGAMGVAALIAFAYADFVEWTDLAFLALYYVMAYFMIASIMAAIGSAVNELREAQSLMTPAMMLLMVPLFLWLPISDAPNGTLAVVTSFIPPLTPFIMILRVTGGEPIAGWQIAATLVIGYAAMLGMMWSAAKIFRIGVLMYGKPPTPMQLLRWIGTR